MSSSELISTSFSAAFSAFQLWLFGVFMFDVLYDSLFLLLMYYTNFHFNNNHHHHHYYYYNYYYYVVCSLFFYFAVSDVGFSAINLTYFLFVCWLAIYRHSFKRCFTILFVSIQTHIHTHKHTNQQTKTVRKIIVITVDYQQNSHFTPI